MYPDTDRPVAQWFAQLRWPLIITTLVLIVFYAVAVVILPRRGFDFAQNVNGEIVVLQTTADSPAAHQLQAGDLIIAVDGWPTARQVDWRWLFLPRAEYTYTVQRGSETFTFTVPVIAYDAGLLMQRWIPFLGAFIAWALGALVLAYATRPNPPAWRTGVVLLATGVLLALDAGAHYFVPGGRLGFAALMPVTALAYAELPLLTPAVSTPRWLRWAFAGGVGAALGLTVLALTEIIWFNPNGQTFPRLPATMPQLQRLFLGLLLLTHPLLLGSLYWRTPPSAAKQQLRILALSSIAAVLPLISVALLPRVLGLNFFNPAVVNGAFIFLLILPLAYAYVIYRHRYLNLDIFFSRGVAWLLLGLVAVVAYNGFNVLMRRWAPAQALEPLPTTMFVLVAVLGAPGVGQLSHRTSRYLLFGPEAYDRALAELSLTLAATPDSRTLGQSLENVCQLLQVRQAALWLTSANGQYRLVKALRVQPASLPATLVPAVLLTRAHFQHTLEVLPDFLRDYPWAEVVLLLRVDQEVVGVWAVGPRLPDGAFNAWHLDFLRRVASAWAIVALAIQLFEASRAMSRQIMQARDAERAALASEIHNEPLQHLSAVVAELGKLARRAETEVAEPMRTCQTAIKDVNQQLRTICAGLRPSILSEGLGLIAEDAVYKFQAQLGADVRSIQVHLDIAPLPAEVAPPPEAATLAVHHVATEALTNIRKHAQAKNVWVTLRQTDQLELTIEDDGMGMPWGDVSMPALVRGEHFGLAGMYEWANLAGGQLTFQPRPAGGTIVRLTGV